MVQDLLGKVQEQVEEWVWGVVLVGEGWVETALGQVPVEVASAPVAEQRFLIRQALLAIT
jgi:hypothetical protein